MKKNLDARVGLIFVSLVLILSIFAFMLLNGSGAWMAWNEKTSSDGFTITASKGSSLTARINSYPIKEINNSTGAYTIDNEVESHELPLDDPSSIVHTSYKKALAIVITVSGATLEERVDVFVNASAAVETFITPALSNYISNCMRITPALVSNDGKLATKNGTAQTFVTIGEESIEKNYSLALARSAVVPAGGTLTLCYIMEYDSSLLKYLGDEILRQELLDENHEAKITYYDDIEFLIYD